MISAAGKAIVFDRVGIDKVLALIPYLVKFLGVLFVVVADIELLKVL